MKRFSLFLIFFLSVSFCLSAPAPQSSSFFKEQVIPAARMTARVTGKIVSGTIHVIGFTFSLVGKVLMKATEKPTELEKTRKKLIALQAKHTRTQNELEEERTQRKSALRKK